MSETPEPLLDVMDSCADALMTACALAFMLDTGNPPTFADSVAYAHAAIERVVERTTREGPRAR